MAKQPTNMPSSNKKKSSRPALSPEAREQQMIGFAVDLAEKKLKDGTASTAIILQYLRLGSTRNQLEMEKIRKDNQLSQAKIENLEFIKHSEELTERAIKAFAKYSGHDDEEDEDDYY